MSTIRKYIIVDDDPTNNEICAIMLQIALGQADIKTFEVPEEALAFIQKEYSKPAEPTILFLDINMPSLTGWEFMEHFEKFTKLVKSQLAIYILSSSVDKRDKDKAKANKGIKGFISKPLNKEAIFSLARV